MMAFLRGKRHYTNIYHTFEININCVETESQQLRIISRATMINDDHKIKFKMKKYGSLYEKGT